ncbi:CD8A protein, partial [Turnix velox]|nr:CD8A protein [Turnix velox]
MDRSPTLLLLLALGLCEYGHGAVCPPLQGGEMLARFRDRRTTHPQMRQRLELECVSDKEDSGTFWIRQDKDGNLYFIVFISSMSKTTFEGNEKKSTRFEASRDGKLYRLAVMSFKPGDEGTYFCLMINNQKLYFSPGLSAFFPGQQHLHITSLSSAKMPTSPGPSLFSFPVDTSKENVTYFCEIFIWVPLAGACLLLLIALAVTVILCQQTRRRRCRCKR